MADLVGLAAHGLGALTSLSLVLVLFDWSLFAYHPTCMAIGYLLLMCEGILEAVGFRSLEGDRRVAAITRHMWWQVSAVVCVGAGFGAIYANKVAHGKEHFLSRHAKVGLATLIFTALAPLIGAASFKSLGIFETLPMWLQQRVKWIHRNVGTVVWVSSLLTIELALTHHAVQKGAFTTFWQGSVVVLGLIVMLKMRQRPTKFPTNIPTHKEVQQ
ncbi:unnamed protein product [Ostreobium quekettii]|uniref:Cytochrome b561 domain-containing protein n=1 Tax=Ostreobium quekettii TaxID=121088 RepID=A0A8S1JD73_9CHLO|nr:unnamed protein product [Ostreobium quekettii]|eukprot:evm.model.scf_281.7 EVM.evm.TU.scf_281.7   scf_281:67400-69887(+)